MNLIHTYLLLHVVFKKYNFISPNLVKLIMRKLCEQKIDMLENIHIPYTVSDIINHRNCLIKNRIEPYKYNCLTKNLYEIKQLSRHPRHIVYFLKYIIFDDVNFLEKLEYPSADEISDYYIELNPTIYMEFIKKKLNIDVYAEKIEYEKKTLYDTMRHYIDLEPI